MKKKSLVTLIIPAYNTEKYISKCLESILKQSYQELEIIILDDGSLDKTNEICQKYVAMDNRIILISKKNTGVSDTRNVGIQNARGKYVIFVDSDDYVTSDYVEVLVRKIEVEDVQMACAEYYVVEEGKTVPHLTGAQANNLRLSSQEAINLLAEKSAFQGYLWNKIFIRDIIIKNNILFNTKIKIWEDMLFCMRYLSQIDSIMYTRKPIYYYVQRKTSAMNDSNVWKEYTHLIALEEMWSFVKKVDGNFKEYIRDYYANELVGMLGKEGFCESAQIRKTLLLVSELDGALNFKHRLKLFLFKYCRPLILCILRYKNGK